MIARRMFLVLISDTNFGVFYLILRFYGILSFVLVLEVHIISVSRIFWEILRLGKIFGKNWRETCIIFTFQAVCKLFYSSLLYEISTVYFKSFPGLFVPNHCFLRMSKKIILDVH